MDKRLLSILCCPVTHKGLSLARPELLKKVNASIDAGELVNLDGATLSRPLKDALLTDDGKLLYPVSDGIPVLLEGESIRMSQVSA